MSTNRYDRASDSDPLREQLNDLHRKLLHIHKILLDNARAAYEAEHGKITAGQMLQLAIGDKEFNWLRSISELIVRIDELMEAVDPAASTEDIQAILQQLRDLLRPSEIGSEFQRKYHAALQEKPNAAQFHKEIMDILSKQ